VQFVRTTITCLSGLASFTAMAVMKYLVLLFALLLPAFALADDCTPIKDALAKLETKPAIVRTLKRQWSPEEKCSVSVGIHIPRAGVQSEIVAHISTLSDDAKCKALGSATMKGEAAQHYYAAVLHNASERKFVEFWISSDSGRLLKTFEALPDKEITVKIDYDDADRIASLFLMPIGRPPSEALPEAP
jgi:hypothetical protein